MEETKIIYHIDDEETPYLVKLMISPERVTLADFKNVLNRPNYKYFFKSMDDDFGVVKEEIVDDDAHLPCFNGRVVSWLVSAEGSNVSDGASQCTDSVAHSDVKHDRVDHVTPGHTNRAPPPLSHDDTLTETESIISSRQGHHLHKSSRHHSDKYEKYNKYNGLRINGHSKHRSGHSYETASVLSSDLETTTFLESDDDASSRITSTTGRHTNMSSAVDRATLDRRRPQRRRRHRLPPMSRTSSFSSITDSTMSLNIITVSLNMDTVNFLGISIVGQSNKGGDGGIYVGSIMKGGAVALDGRIEPGDMILQVNDINFENMSNDEAVRVLREVVQKPGPIKLVVAKCWDPNPKGYFTIPRTEPVRPIDPGAWVAHTAAIRGEGFPPRPPSATTLTSTSSSLASTLPDTERPIEELHLTINTDMPTIVRAMARPDSGLEIRDRMWLKITIPNAFIGADVVDWLNSHVEGFIDRRDARKYASLMLKAGFIRHTVNKITFSEQCYYIFGDLCSAMSSMKLDCDTVGPLPPPSAWDMPYSGTYAPHSATGYSPMPFNFTNEPTVYGYHREESVHSGSGGSSAGSEHICKEPIHDLKSCSSASESELHMPTVPSMPNKNAGNGNGSNGKRSNGSRSRSSGSEQSVQTGTGSGNQQNPQDLSESDKLAGSTVRKMSQKKKKSLRKYQDERHELSCSETNYGSIDRSNMLQDENILETLTARQDSGNSNGSVNYDVGTHFRDGRRKIDFLLVYEEAVNSRTRLYSTGSNSVNSGKSSINTSNVQIGISYAEKRSQKLEMWRQRFMTDLRRSSLDMEEEIVENGHKKQLCFIKLHATWSVLCHYAEELNMRAPLQAHPNPSEHWSATALAFLRLPNIMQEDVPKKPMDFYTCPFRKSKIDRFLGSDNHDTYFTNVQRSRVVYEILSTAIFGKKKKGEVGIDRLVEEGVFLSAFPLHDGPYEVKRKNGKIQGDLNPRQILYEYWARWGKWYKYQPLDHIREYFGEKIAIYFAWLGFYTAWLLPAAVVGALVFLYGVLTMGNNQLAEQVCNSGNEFLMCPLCADKEACKPWPLTDVCAYAKLAYLFDHPGTVFYAIFVSFWAVSFLEYWKRKSVSLAHHWDCMGFQEDEERPRPEFAARAPFLERNPITGVREPSFPSSVRHKRIAAGIGIIFLMMSLVIIFIVAVIIYRVLVSIPLFQNSTFRSQAQAIANVTGAVVNLILIMTMSRVYEKLAYRLTTWEMHRTQTEFDDNLTFKVFIFQFVNFYSSIFYIAFFKGRFVGYPGNYSHILGLRNEDCSAGGCLIELAQQLAVIMIGKQIINNAQEILVPKLKAWWHKHQTKLPQRQKTSWEQDYQLIDSEGLFQEYMEIVLQFGFITIFVAAFPLAPLFALLNNWVEIRLDAQKFVCETRRSVAERAENIGIWFKILDMLAHLAVISNGFLIAFTSEFLPKLLYQYEYDWNLDGYVNFTLSHAPNEQQCRYRGLRDEKGDHTPFFWRLLAVRFAFVIIFEHVVFVICRLIDILVPDIPESLELKIKRERYLAKQALQDSDTIMKVAAFEDDFYDNNDPDPISPNSGMVLDLTAELGNLHPKSPNSTAEHTYVALTNENSPKRSPRSKSYSSTETGKSEPMRSSNTHPDLSHP